MIPLLISGGAVEQSTRRIGPNRKVYVALKGEKSSNFTLGVLHLLIVAVSIVPIT